jgi:hypothetical protein
MAAVATFAVGTVAVPSTLLRTPPTPTITAPTGTVTSDDPLTVTWTYLSPLSRPQVSYRVVLAQPGGTVLFDSGTIAGADVSYELDYPFQAFTNYVMWVGVNDGLDGGDDPFSIGGDPGFGWDSQSFFTQFAAAGIYTPNQKVGSIYEIGINGVGLMLNDTPQRPVQRQVQQLDSQAPGSEAGLDEEVGRYRFVVHNDWVGGEGQLYLDRLTSDPSRYWRSEWINPFEPGELTVNEQPVNYIADAYATPRAVVASESVYVQTADDELTARDTPGGSNTAFDPGLAGTIVDLASDGTYWYATDGTTVRRNSTAADPAGNWSTEDVTEIEWCTDRIMGIDNVADPAELISFDPAGTGTVIFTHIDAELKGVCGGDGSVWYGVNYSTSGHVRYWTVDSSPTAGGIALTLPEGEKIETLYFDLGNVFLASHTDGHMIKIYRCVASEGLLTPQFIVETGHAHSGPVCFAGKDRFVAFSWPEMMSNQTTDTQSGIGVIDLETGGYARWQAANQDGTTGADATVPGVVRWAGEFAFTLGGVGFFGVHATGDKPDEAYLETSVSDLGSNVGKVLESFAVSTWPLAGTLEFELSVDTNTTFTSFAEHTTAASTDFESALSASGLPVMASSAGIRFILKSVGTGTPTIKQATLKAYPLGLADQMLSYPVNCDDHIADLSDSTIAADSGLGKGYERVKFLESLVGTLVTLQDVDWKRTGSVQICQMVGAQTTTTGTKASTANMRVDSAVCVITLRAPLS